MVDFSISQMPSKPPASAPQHGRDDKAEAGASKDGDTFDAAFRASGDDRRSSGSGAGAGDASQAQVDDQSDGSEPASEDPGNPELAIGVATLPSGRPGEADAVRGPAELRKQAALGLSNTGVDPETPGAERAEPRTGGSKATPTTDSVMNPQRPALAAQAGANGAGLAEAHVAEDGIEGDRPGRGPQGAAGTAAGLVALASRGGASGADARALQAAADAPREALPDVLPPVTKEALSVPGRDSVTGRAAPVDLRAAQVAALAGAAKTALVSEGALELSVDVDILTTESTTRTASTAAAQLAGGAGAPVQGGNAVMQQIVQVMRDRMPEPGVPVEIALDPPELGRVRMSVGEAAGQIALFITAERPETAELMRRHLAMLTEEFGRSGLDAPNVSISQEGSRDGSGAQERPETRAADRHDGDLGDPDAPVAHQIARSATGTRILDLRL